MKRRNPGRVPVVWDEDGPTWYIIVGRLAICNHHGPPHLHAHPDRRHPDHARKVPVAAGLTCGEALDRVDQLCRSLRREPNLDELKEALR